MTEKRTLSPLVETPLRVEGGVAEGEVAAVPVGGVIAAEVTVRNRVDRGVGVRPRDYERSSAGKRRLAFIPFALLGGPEPERGSCGRPVVVVLAEGNYHENEEGN